MRRDIHGQDAPRRREGCGMRHNVSSKRAGCKEWELSRDEGMAKERLRDATAVSKAWERGGEVLFWLHIV